MAYIIGAGVQAFQVYMAELCKQLGLAVWATCKPQVSLKYLLPCLCRRGLGHAKQTDPQNDSSRYPQFCDTPMPQAADRTWQHCRIHSRTQHTPQQSNAGCPIICLGFWANYSGFHDIPNLTPTQCPDTPSHEAEALQSNGPESIPTPSSKHPKLQTLNPRP